MIFHIWTKKQTDGKAPDFVFLNDDYDYAGEIEAESKIDLLRKINTKQDGINLNRSLTVGDVIRRGELEYFILTPQLYWASVYAEWVDTDRFGYTSRKSEIEDISDLDELDDQDFDF